MSVEDSTSGCALEPRAVCERCGKPTKVFASSGRVKRFCSSRCRNATVKPCVKLALQPCSTCGKAFRSRRRTTQRYCSKQCSNNRPRRTAECPKCGQRFKTRAARPGYCLTCQDERRAGHARERRVERYGAETEPYTKREIFNRDGWTCQICGKPCRRDVNGRHPEGATVDHIVPFSKGGNDLKSNVQCAHLRCNLSKASKTAITN